MQGQRLGVECLGSRAMDPAWIFFPVSVWISLAFGFQWDLRLLVVGNISRIAGRGFWGFGWPEMVAAANERAISRRLALITAST